MVGRERRSVGGTEEEHPKPENCASNRCPPHKRTSLVTYISLKISNGRPDVRKFSTEELEPAGAATSYTSS